MESHFQEEFASLEDETKARAQLSHVFQYDDFITMSLKSYQTAATSRNRGDIGRTHDPEVARNTTDIEYYVLVPRMLIHNLIRLAVGVENSFWCIRLYFRSYLSTFDLKGSS